MAGLLWRWENCDLPRVLVNGRHANNVMGLESSVVILENRMIGFSQWWCYYVHPMLQEAPSARQLSQRYGNIMKHQPY